ncbi:MAG: phosphocholine cytidylyltransferase family protein [Gammaproteobacteria bacterium]
MKAIILAAGIGNRLGPDAGGRPKCLLRFNGVSLLSRHITILATLPVTEVLIVTGYRSEEIDGELASINSGLSATTIFNPDYRSGSLISLYTARGFVNPDEPCLLMDADVLYHRDILARLASSSHENCFLLDRDFIPGEEPVKLCVRDGRLVDFRKQIATDLVFDYQGESVGFFRFSGDIMGDLMRRAGEYLDRRDNEQPYEELIRDCLLEYPQRFSFEDITGLPWLEIDFPEDLIRAEREILPRIEGQ